MAGGISSCHWSDGAVPTALSRHPEAVGDLTLALPYRNIVWVSGSVWCAVKLLYYIHCPEFCPAIWVVSWGEGSGEVLLERYVYLLT